MLSMKNVELVQKYLVDRANNEIHNILKSYCRERFHSLDYYEVIKDMLDKKVIEIPNPQIWVDDSYFTNSTTFSLMQVAKKPYTYATIPVDYSVPNDNPHFAEDAMDSTTAPAFYDRYLAELTNLFHLLREYYPTHRINVYDFGLALFTVWESATTQLLAEVKPKYKRFFTHHMLNQFITALSYPVGDINPNINLILYDEIGLLTQSVNWRKNGFWTRFKPAPQFNTTCKHEWYTGFMYDLMGPMRSMKAILKPYRLPDIEIREVKEFDLTSFHALQWLCECQRRTNSLAVYDAFTELAVNNDVEGARRIMEVYGEGQRTSRLNAFIRNCKKEKMDFRYAGLEEKNKKVMDRRGIIFTEYDFTMDLLPEGRIFSEVMINMDNFRREFPSRALQNFREVYLMAEAINSARRTFIKKFPRPEWVLCTKINVGSEDFEFADVAQQLNEQIKSDSGDNFITTIER